jgi:hypothetical protein
MPNSLTRELKHDVEDTLADVAAALRKAADDLSEDAEKAIAQAAVALRHAAQALAEKTPPKAKALAAQAAKEVKEHPIASAAAALTAAATLITVLGHARKRST